MPDMFTPRLTTMFRALAMACVAIICASIAVAEPQLKNARVPVADGIALATDVYLPDRVPAPVVLVRTPYGRAGFAFLAEALAAEGYAVAMQDVRGKYDSDGDHEPFRHERHDSLASLKWIAAQEWCDGRIGMWGSSYSGYAALAVADVEMDAFQSIFSISGWMDVAEVVRPGGANHLLLNLPWMLTQQGASQRSLKDFEVEALFRHLPMRDALKAAGIRNPSWEAGLEDTLVRRRDLGEVSRPIFHLTGWHDMVYRATLSAWNRLSAKATAPQRLAIGPWYHNQFLFGAWEVGDRHFGEASAMGTDEIVALTLRWFDETLKDKPQPKNNEERILSWPAVSFFMMDQNAWHREAQWPPSAPVIEARRFYLNSGGEANGSAGDGALTTGRAGQAAADHFVFDPQEPVPTLGGANFFYFPELVGVRDQRDIETRNDVLVYTSAPLTEALQVTGKVAIRLRVASSAPDTDFTGKLVVVAPDGYARIVEDGIVRVSHALSTPPPPGEPFTVTIGLGHTAIEVPKGHRLRVEISSSNFPKYDRNPNTGADAFLATELQPADQTVFHGKGQESFLILPVRRKSLAVTSAKTQPLSRAREQVTQVTQVVGSDAEKLLTTGRGQLDKEEIDQALATLKRAVELAPESSPAHYWLGQAFLAKLNKASMLRKLGFAKKTRGSFQRAIELDPGYLTARESLAQFYFQAPGIAGGSTEKGQEQVAIIREQDPKAAHRLMAQHYTSKGKRDLAEKELQALIALDPQDAGTHLQLAMNRQAMKDWDAAFEAFEKVLRLDGENLGALYQLGRTGALSGQRLPRAKQAFEQYISSNPESDKLPSVAHAHWRLGMVHEQLGDKAGARRQYETALKLNDTLDEAREALKNL